MEQDFITIGENSDSNSDSGSGSGVSTITGDSNMEIFSSVKDRLAVSKDYWFGKKYFECVIAQDLFEKAHPNNSINFLDAQFQATIAAYDFNQNLRLLQGRKCNIDHATRSGQKPYQAFMMLVGRIIRTGSVAEKRALIETIRGRQDSKAPSLSSSESHTAASDELDYEFLDRPRHSYVSKDSGSLDISRYTSALKERGDQIGVIPAYRNQTVALNPPCFRIVVSFQDYAFDGTGRTLKAAKHQASKEMCKFLGIKPI